MKTLIVTITRIPRESKILNQAIGRLLGEGGQFQEMKSNIVSINVLGGGGRNNGCTLTPGALNNDSLLTNIFIIVILPFYLTLRLISRKIRKKGS